MRRLLDYWKNQAGNTALVFGLAVIPLIALGGGIVDFAHRAQVRDELQNAADTAAIAAARVLQLGQLTRAEDMEAVKADAVAAADRVIDAALSNLGGAAAANVSIVVDPDTDVVQISANIDVDTAFLGVIGLDTLGATTASEVALPDPILIEISMVLDYSGSMNDSDKYTRMTDAARAFIAKVDTERGDTSLIGIVPFSEYVYTAIDAGYLRSGGGGDDDDDDDEGGGGSSGGTGTVTTCLLNRDYPYSATDAPPVSGLAGSQWPEGSASKCDDYADRNLLVRDLTNEFAELDTALSTMTPLGLTNISLAMEMGWHMMTPELPYDTARDFSDEFVRKVIILLTDGMQTVPAEGPGGGYGTDAANETTAELCQGAKDQGIRIFSIAYDVSDPTVESLLAGCADGPDSYFDPSVSEISEVFEEIYSQIAESVWVSR